MNSYTVFIESSLNLISFYVSVTKRKLMIAVRGSQRNTDRKENTAKDRVFIAHSKTRGFVSRKALWRGSLGRWPLQHRSPPAAATAVPGLVSAPVRQRGASPGFPQIPYPASPSSFTVLWPYKIWFWTGIPPRVKGRRWGRVKQSHFHPPSSPSAPSPGNLWCHKVPVLPGISAFAWLTVMDIFSGLLSYSLQKAKQKK